MTRIYLDHAATTPLRPEAREAMLRGFELWANPSSPHADGRKGRAALEVSAMFWTWFGLAALTLLRPGRCAWVEGLALSAGMTCTVVVDEGQGGDAARG